LTFKCNGLGQPRWSAAKRCPTVCLGVVASAAVRACPCQAGLVVSEYGWIDAEVMRQYCASRCSAGR